MKYKKLRRWLKEIGLFVFIAVVFSIGVDLWRQQSIPVANAPNIVGQSIDGKSVDIFEMSKEKPVIVYFWATWCPVCKFVSPTINLIDKMDSYEVIGVSISSGPDDRIAKFLESHHYDFSNLNDSRGLNARSWGILVTPTIAVVKGGQIQFVTTGFTTPIGLLARIWFV
ncbi:MULTISPECIES: protein disulfide oxidoreductase [Vibrio harveyi group]|uniref:protein disulfide oxidoreductase n=1 Tax=Vibrio harveyi group TaxID=717610 RepID=UPI00211C8DC4|nr:protein disulfide oxidoreductase [Vibrio alginolyticus]EJL8715932.1 protein disulfide oxidoreductase [Vibrio alginolyticus]MCQ9247420.1 protein disulfide oxidoreductase [Vibrio diabolicus]